MTFTEFIDLVLVRLYDLGDSNALHSVNQIADELREPVPEDWPRKAAQSLESRGFVMAAISAGDSAHALITGDGMLYVEGKSHATSAIETYRAQPSIYVTITGDSNQVAVTGSGSIAQTASENLKEILGLFEEIAETLREATLDQDELQEYLVEVETAKRQVTKPKPNLAAARALLEPLANVAVVAELVQQVLRLLGHG